MDDVGPDGDMHRDRDTKARRRRDETQRPVPRRQLEQAFPDRLSDPLACRYALVDRRIQQRARLLGHAEAAGPESVLHFFGRGGLIDRV